MKKLIRAKGTEFEQNGCDLVIIDTNFRAGKPIMLNSAELDMAILNGQQEALEKIEIEDKEDLSEEISLYNNLITEQEQNIKNVLTSLEDRITIESYVFAPDWIAFSQWDGEELDYEMQNLDTSNMVTMGYMFRLCKSLKTLDLSGFNTDKVTNMELMFQGCESLEKLNLSSFNFDNVTKYDSMLKDIPANCEIIVKDTKAQEFILTARNDLTNVVIL